MARVAKVDNALKKRLKREEKKRPVNTKPKLLYFLIICEGTRTEPFYFEAIKNRLPKNLISLKIEGTGLNTLGLVDYTIDQRNNASRKYDQVWAVFDKDDFPSRNFNAAIKKGDKNDIKCAWTNEAFELWFLLHFQYVDSGMSRELYKGFLEREIKNKTGNDAYVYLKNDPQTFDILNSYGNQERAINWAKRIIETYTDKKFANHNPCTRVFELIEELNKFLI